MSEGYWTVRTGSLNRYHRAGTSAYPTRWAALAAAAESARITPGRLVIVRNPDGRIVKRYGSARHGIRATRKPKALTGNPLLDRVLEYGKDSGCRIEPPAAKSGQWRIYSHDGTKYLRLVPAEGEVPNIRQVTVVDGNQSSLMSDWQGIQTIAEWPRKETWNKETQRWEK